MAAAEAFFGLPLAPEVVEHALGTVRVPGRFEIVGRSPVVVLDGAHNVAGAHALARALRAELALGDDTVVVIGMLQGRDPSAMLEALRPAGLATVVACTAPSPRALPAASIAEAARALGLAALAADTVADALQPGPGAAVAQRDPGGDRLAVRGGRGPRRARRID